ncbi:MAG: hypothetical protein K8S14_02735 [Actinomycetia bacterium]|nr:hypothetical protein [Actinomycetes bacterium]
MLTPARPLVPTLAALIALGVVFAWAATPAVASTVVPMNLDTIADHSGQVVVGRVTEVRSYWADNPRRIESEVTFDNVEYLKGRLSGSTDKFSLIVPGGTVDDMRMAVCCAPVFKVGDKWALCLLSAYKTFPVVGLYQGAFLVQPDAKGIERIAYRRHGVVEPISGFGADGFVRVAHNGRRSAEAHLREANGVRVKFATADDEPGEAMSYAEFVARISPVLAASRDHKLSAPAGRRILVQPTAVPLQRSALQRSIDRGEAQDRSSVPNRVRGERTPREVESAPRPVVEDGKEVR